MARTQLKHKTAVVLGADTPAGRAIALQLSREGVVVVLAGHDGRRLALLKELIDSKVGHTWVAKLSKDAEKAAAEIREAGEELGNHINFAVNAMAAASDPADRPGQSADEARFASDVLLSVVSGKGNFRLVTIWPDESGPVPEVPAEAWHSVIRMEHVENSHDEAESSLPPTAIKAAGCADAVVYLLCCPPSACPVEVRLEPRSIKI